MINSFFNVIKRMVSNRRREVRPTYYTRLDARLTLPNQPCRPTGNQGTYNPTKRRRASKDAFNDRLIINAMQSILNGLTIQGDTNMTTDQQLQIADRMARATQQRQQRQEKKMHTTPTEHMARATNYYEQGRAAGIVEAAAMLVTLYSSPTLASRLLNECNLSDDQLASCSEALLEPLREIDPTIPWGDE